jgi:hypothetical protein
MNNIYFHIYPPDVPHAGMWDYPSVPVSLAIARMRLGSSAVSADTPGSNVLSRSGLSSATLPNANTVSGGGSGNGNGGVLPYSNGILRDPSNLQVRVAFRVCSLMHSVLS